VKSVIILFAVAGMVTAAGCASTPPPVPAASAPVLAEAKAPAALPRPAPCPDGDHDGVCDADDRCLTRAGPRAAFGCPIDPCSGTPLLVLVQFKYDSAVMPAWKAGEVQTMDPVLDAVASAIEKDPACRVCIVGHASEEGATAYNEGLSLRRASAVESYLSGRGLSATRMPTTGMGERCQLVPESTLELNRRVEFRRLSEGSSCPTECSS